MPRFINVLVVAASATLAVCSSSFTHAASTNNTLPAVEHDAHTLYASHAHDPEASFNHYMKLHGKQYQPQDVPARLSAYQANYEIVRRHNEEAAAGRHKYTLAMNQFADLSNEEYRSLMLGYRASASSLGALSTGSDHKGNALQGSTLRVLDELPASIDWRARNVVTEPKNQGSCGACWAFASAAAIEGAHALATGNLIDLSPQVLVDCVNEGGNTCSLGGEMTDAYAWVMAHPTGIPIHTSYPYTQSSGNRCTYTSDSGVARISGYGNVSRHDEQGLTQAIARHPGVSVGIDAGQPTFQLYAEGVYDEPACKTEMGEINHGVLAVGYGTDAEAGAYYLIKNSWGPWWGQGGYIKMSRNKQNQCGIATDASYPLV